MGNVLFQHGKEVFSDDIDRGSLCVMGTQEWIRKYRNFRFFQYSLVLVGFLPLTYLHLILNVGLFMLSVLFVVYLGFYTMAEIFVSYDRVSSGIIAGIYENGIQLMGMPYYYHRRFVPFSEIESVKQESILGYKRMMIKITEYRRPYFLPIMFITPSGVSFIEGSLNVLHKKT